MQGFDSSSLARVVATHWPHPGTRRPPAVVAWWLIWHGLYGAAAARLTPDQKVGSLNLSAAMCNSYGQWRPPTSLLARPGVAAWSRHPARMRSNSGSIAPAAACLGRPLSTL